MKPLKPPTAMPISPPPAVAPSASRESLTTADLWVVATFFIALIALLLVFGLQMMRMQHEAQAYAVMLRSQAGNAPVSSHVACDFSLDNLTVHEGPREQSDVRIDRITAHCEGNAQLPARLLTEVSE